jgi:hypothetical protein
MRATASTEKMDAVKTALVFGRLNTRALSGVPGVMIWGSYADQGVSPTRRGC